MEKNENQEALKEEIERLKKEIETLKKSGEKPKKKPNPSDGFKKKYFEYYDDIKISHREDW